MKKDCRDIFTFVKEWRRRGKIEGTPYSLKFNVEDITEKVVNELQKWSDEHPVAPRREVFLKLFPNADIKTINPCDMDKKIASGERCKDCHKCWEKFWNEEIAE